MVQLPMFGRRESVFSYLNQERVADRAVVVDAEDPFGELGYEVCDVNDPRGEEVLSHVSNFYNKQITIISHVNPLLKHSYVKFRKFVYAMYVIKTIINGSVVGLSPDENTQRFMKDLDLAVQKYIDNLPYEDKIRLREGSHDETRRLVLSPHFVPLKKDQEYFVGVIYKDSTTLVLGAEPIWGMQRRARGTETFSGLRMEHFLIRGQKGRYLDLMSILPENSIFQALFLFSSKVPSVSGPWVYPVKFNDGKKITLLFPGSVYMAFKIVLNQYGQQVWDTESARHMWLHELGHIYFFDVDSIGEFTIAEIERNAHAFALAFESEINRKYPNEGFFNVKACREIAQHYLKTYDQYSLKAYDPESLDKPRTVREAKELLRYQASTLRRNEVRKMVLDLKEKSMIHKILENLGIFRERVDSLIKQVPSLRRNIPK